jgi:hypothetical protein
MNDQNFNEKEEIFSKVIRAGRRTYFFDVRETKAGDYYLTITESKKFSNEDGSFHYRKHKIFLYKEDFAQFKDFLNEATDFIIKEKGEEVISERHQKDFIKPSEQVQENTTDEKVENEEEGNTDNFTDVNFEDI